METAAAYARYSTANQNETSIAAQLTAIEDYCKVHSITIVKHYIDEARSGTNTDREGFQALLADARAGLFDAVIIYDISRGSRNVSDWFSFRQTMATLQVRVISVTNTLGDPDDPDAYLTELLSVGIGQHQVLQIRQKSIAGKRICAERGLFNGGTVPYGYRIVDRHYVIDEPAATHIRILYDMYARGCKYNDINDAIEQAGGRRFSKQAFRHMLSNERYIGRYVYFKMHYMHMRKYIGNRPGDSPVVIDDAIPRIISDDLWQAVQARREANRPNKLNKSRKDRVYLLAGIIHCAQCGYSMSGATSIVDNGSRHYEYRQYRCMTNSRRSERCGIPLINANQLDGYVYELLRDCVLNDDAIEQTADMILSEIGVQFAGRGQKEREAIRADISAIDTRLNNLFMAVENGMSSPATIKRVNALTNQRAALEARLSALEAHLRMQSGSMIALPTRESIVEVLRADMAALTNTPTILSLKPLIQKYVRDVRVGWESVAIDIATGLNFFKHGHVCTHTVSRVTIQNAKSIMDYIA